MSASIDVVWLRDDFRLDDQPSIHAAADRPALFVYVHDEAGAGARPLGGAAKWRLAESLTAMEAALSARGARLDIVKGGAEEAILTLAAATDASRVLWSRRYEGEAIALDARVKAALKERGVEATSFNGRLMREPWELSKPRRRAGPRLYRLLAPPSSARAPARSDASAQTPDRGAVASRSAPARFDRVAQA